MCERSVRRHSLGHSSELLHLCVYGHQFSPARFAKRLERIDGAIVNTFVKFFDRNVRREILLHNELHDFNRLPEDRVGGAEPDAVE